MDTKVEILYPAPMPPMTEEEKASSRRLIEKLKAEGHPLAEVAGMSMDDPTFDDFLAEMREYRRQVEEDPNY